MKRTRLTWALMASALVFALPSCGGGGGGGGGTPTGPTGTGSGGGTTTATPTPTPTPSENQPPNLSFNVTPREGQAPLEVKMNMCPTEDPEDDPKEYTFDFGGGSRGNCSDGSDAGCRQCATYAAAGSYTARGCVTDNAPGRTPICDSATVSVASAKSLDVSASAAGCMLEGSATGINFFGTAGQAPDSVRFFISNESTGSSFDVDGNQDSSNPNKWTFAEPVGEGKYKVEARAFDSGGEEEARGTASQRPEFGPVCGAP